MRRLLFSIFLALLATPLATPSTVLAQEYSTFAAALEIRDSGTPDTLRIDYLDRLPSEAFVFHNSPTGDLVNDIASAGSRTRIIRSASDPQGDLGTDAGQEANALTGTIAGRVVDAESGETLPGVNVRIVGTQRGTATGPDGQYRLPNVEAGRYTIRASFIGYGDATQEGVEVTSGETTPVDFSLKPQATGLEEVVVVGYGTEREVNLTGAVDQVGTEALDDRPVTSVAQALQGRMPNLNITFNDGQPGNQEASYNIRGTNSINGGSPLVLIDGVPGDPDRLNPNNIESVSVLKDADAAAVYGGRAAFGVILITTKEGSAEQGLQVHYAGNVASNSPTILPEAITDTYTSMQIQSDAYEGYSGVDFYSEEALDYARRRSENPSLPAVVINETDQGETYNYYGSTDWMDEMYKSSSLSTKHSLSVSGGAERVNYYLSGDYQRQNGIFEYDSDNFNQYNFRGKVNVDVRPWLELRNNFAYNRSDYEYPTAGSEEGVNDLIGDVADLNRAQEVLKNPDGTWTYHGSTVGFLQDGGRGTQRESTLRNILEARFAFLNDRLTFRTRYSYQSDGYETNELYKRVPYKGGSAAGGPSSGYTDFAGVSRARQMSANNYRHVVDAFAKYEDTWGAHRFNGTLGYNQEVRSLHLSEASRDDLVSSNLGSLNLAVGNTNVDEEASEWALRGVFYRLGYDYDDRYLVEFNGRYDGSSRFPEGDRYGFFPSFSAGWRISEESFMDGIEPVVTNLKLRGSYGSLGNQDVDSAYPYVPTMPSRLTETIVGGEQLVAVDAPGLVPRSLTWEQVSTLDFGLDLSMFSGRLEMTFDWYERNTTDMLTRSRTLPAVLGTEEPRENAADLRTRGWELSAKWGDDGEVFGRSFQYSLGASLSDYQSVITSFDNPNGYLGDFYEGRELGEIWGYETAGFYQSEEELEQHADQSNIVRFPDRERVGDLKLTDRNGDGVIGPGAYTLADHGDVSVIGNTTPRYRYGFNARLSWGNVSLSTFFQGVGRRDYYPTNEASSFWSVYNRYYNTAYKHIEGNYWTPENRDAYFPRLKSYEALGSVSEDNAENPAGILAAPQTRYLQDASYLRLKNLTVGYSLPQSLIAPTGVSQVRIYFSGENLWETTDLRVPVDPELLMTPEGGTGYASPNGRKYPIQRAYSMGVDIRF
jgi:TonB-linked SusC/RagA family outer membrane protein